MSTIPYPESQNSGAGCLLVFAVAVVVAVVVTNAGLGNVMATATTSLGVNLNGHAEKHAEAAEIRYCLDQNGPSAIYKAKWWPTWYLTCEISPGRWGFQAVTKSGQEKTAFSPGNGTFADLMEYLNGFATRFKGVPPWLR